MWSLGIIPKRKATRPEDNDYSCHTCPGCNARAVAPGLIDTDMSNFTKTEEGHATVTGMQTLKRTANLQTSRAAVLWSLPVGLAAAHNATVYRLLSCFQAPEDG